MKNKKKMGQEKPTSLFLVSKIAQWVYFLQQELKMKK